MAQDTLFVQEYSGDFAQWVETKTIDEPEDSKFSFKNTLPNIASATWQLSDQPIPGDVLSNNFGGFLGSGAFQPPAQDKAKVIAVSWKDLVPASVPSGAKYYFRVVSYQGVTGVLASN